jgi:universal stress protein E
MNDDAGGSWREDVELRTHRVPSLSSVLVCTDLSKSAERAVERATRLRIASGGHLRLVHVLPVGATAESESAALASAELTLAGWSSARPDLQVSARVVRGPPYEAIVAEAEAEPRAELVLVGRHGRRTFRRQLIGTTAERVIRHGTIPVLVVQLPARRSYRRLLVAIELPPDRQSRAVSLALQLGPFLARRQVVHVTDDPHSAAGETLRAWFDRRFGPDFRVRWRVSTPTGDPRVRILATAKFARPDLLVLGTHARAGLQRLWLGSVAEAVLRAATCDVLVARPEPDPSAPP